MRMTCLTLHLLLLASPVLAQDCNGAGPIIAIRADGVPFYTHQEPDVYQAVVDAVRPRIGDRSAEFPILALDTRNNAVAWVNRSQLKGFVDITEASLRENLVYKGPTHCRPKDIPWEFDDPAYPGREPIPLPTGQPIPEPIDLFPEESSGPRGGLWRAEIGPTEMIGCPAMMRDAFPASAGALPGMTGDTRRMSFADPFHPDTLEMSQTTGVRWNAAGENRWISTDLGAEAFAQIPTGEGGGSRIVWTLTVISHEEMRFERSIKIILPAVAAAAMGISADGCRVIGEDRWVRVGD